MTVIDPTLARDLSTRLAEGPRAVIDLVNGLVKSLPGVRTVTWLAVAPDHSVSHRIGTSDPQGFPIGGSDPIDDGAMEPPDPRRQARRRRGHAGTDARVHSGDRPTRRHGLRCLVMRPDRHRGEVRGVLCALGDAGILTPALLAEIDTLLPIAALVFTFFQGISHR